MTAQPPNSSILGVDWRAAHNNPLHHTGALSKHLLVARRGQSFSLQVQLKHPYDSREHKLTLTAQTGEQPEERRGTQCVFGIPDAVKRSPRARGVWSAALDPRLCSAAMGTVALTVTPPASAPVGRYTLRLLLAGQEHELGALVLLYNPWCPDDWVYLPEEAERQEYVMNQHGVIYKGSGNYITSMDWDFAQFEEKMVQICLMMLDLSHKHLKDPADDVSARCNPIYVSRIVSAMINSEDDRGVLNGRWCGNFIGGLPPSHWSGSYPILQRWLADGCHPVKFGQCWVFAGVMCSVLRLLGIPCRVVTNYQSAHDNDKNLIVDVYHADYGVKEIPSVDSVWNYHVWVEAWMKRPDLAPGYDGWQVLDPTPQEKSNGVFCCGPAPVAAVLNGCTDLKYDVPFVFAEVNADCIDWLVKADGSKIQIHSDTKRVGQNISTKSVGSSKRQNITSSYKHTEGSEEERAIFKYAITRDYSRSDETEYSEALGHGPDDKQEEEEGGGTIARDGPAVTGPAVTGPAVTGPAVTGPAVTGPAVTGPAVTGPAVTGPAVTGPAVTGLAVTGPAVTGPAVTGPAVTGPAVTGPAVTGPAVTGPAVTGPAVTGPAVTGPAMVNGTGSRTSNNVVEMVDVETRGAQPPPQVTMRFEEVSKPLNGKDVKVNLVLHSETSEPRPLSIHLSVTAASYSGAPLCAIQSELQHHTLLPGRDLYVPVGVAFSRYRKPMLDGDVMKISTVVSDTGAPHEVYLAESDVVLLDPPIHIQLLNEARVAREVVLDVSFQNPLDETLKQCLLTLSGSGLWREEQRVSLPEIRPGTRVRVTLSFYPYTTGQRTLVADFNCSAFRHIKSSLAVHVKDNWMYR